MTDQPEAPPTTPVRTLALATLAALIVAIIVLVVAVLPAEYGIDPTGAGEALGLTVMAGEGTVELTAMSETANTAASPLLDAPRSYNQDSITFTLGPERWVEYKYALGQGGTFLYQWEASGPLTFDFHTEPVGTGGAESESFAQGSASGDDGSYRAPYSGFHGWYLLNEGTADVDVTIRASGFFTQSREYRENGSFVDHDLRPQP